ncbi:unnamed protein product [Diatraea saccharalis]|uniref:Uncharacterized protein n=1 Tax=Diatraea saccharalis TaxID=40085 RepID=A0A9N9QV92_9NEOP|nr:unnamed protein product [Diatraea saccharalis]
MKKKTTFTTPVHFSAEFYRQRTAPKAARGCRRAGSLAAARHMLPTPAPLAPLDPNKTRALTTIYAPRKFKPRKNKTAQSRMLDDVPVKPTLSPFHPLPAIGQKTEKANTKVILFDFNKNERTGLGSEPLKIHDVLKPLTPLRIHGFMRNNSLDQIDKKKPQQLLRENTYDVIEPIYLNSVKVRKRDSSVPRKIFTPDHTENKKEEERPKISPKTRFRKAALQVAKLSSMPETGKLLCLRERQTFNICPEQDEDSACRLQELPHSPTQKLDKLSEIFQTLEMRGRHRDKMKKENSWF